MAEFVLERKQVVDAEVGRLFDFFADAKNLEVLTPPELNFKIITPDPIVIQKGTIIDYQLRLRGFPITWKTEITQWNPPYDFVDTALYSPYKQWIHLHKFSVSEDGKTVMEDIVRYRLPLEPLGDLAHFYVKSELNYIFEYRRKTVEKLFGSERI